MNKLIIVGNGFDLAHNYETRYQDFLKHIFISGFDKGNSFFEFFRDKIDGIFFSKQDEYYQFFLKNLDGLSDNSTIQIKNEFLFRLYKRMEHNKGWVDIEKEYFDYLYRLSPENAISLNQQFDEIKIELEGYLKDITREQYVIFDEYLGTFIEKGFKDEVLFVNFNYTDTLKYYSITLKNEFNIENKIVHIHGEVNGINNRIIFGYGDEFDPRYNELKGKNENQYLRNIKSSHVNSAYSEILEFIRNPFEVHVFGHSLGISDRTFLNELFTSSNMRSIELHYYNGNDGYDDLRMNLSRICRDNSSYKKKVIAFDKTRPMPQTN